MDIHFDQRMGLIAKIRQALTIKETQKAESYIREYIKLLPPDEERTNTLQLLSETAATHDLIGDLIKICTGERETLS